MRSDGGITQQQRRDATVAQIRLVIVHCRTRYNYEFTASLHSRRVLFARSPIRAIHAQTAVKCVLLADRHHGLIEGIRHLLDKTFGAVIMVADANSLFEGAARLEPALAVVDLSLSPTDGLNLLRTLRSRCPDLKVIVLSMHDEPTVVRSAMDAGANGYVLKNAISTDLLPAVDVVLAGNSYVSPAIPFETSKQ